MCERTYCRHEHERLCSCPPVACRDALGMAAHLAENMEKVQWSLTYEGHTDLAPYEFFECCNEKSDDEILGAAVQHYDVVEIDDGIKPAFFYKTEHGYELLFSFDAKIAKKNIREEID